MKNTSTDTNYDPVINKYIKKFSLLKNCLKVNKELRSMWWSLANTNTTRWAPAESVKRAPPPPPPDADKAEPGSKSEGEDEPPHPPAKRGLGRTPNHLTLRYQHMYGQTSTLITRLLTFTKTLTKQLLVSLNIFMCITT
jgi:hypothetical protein